MHTVTINANTPIPITNNSIDASRLSPFSNYDNGYLNTAVCSSSITFIDGDKGILRYRGYDILDLATHSSFVEVSYLLIYGNLPNKLELSNWSSRIMRHTFIHQNLSDYLKSFRFDSHPVYSLNLDGYGYF